MATIWKFPLRVDAVKTTVLLPAGSEVLFVESQVDELFLWAKVDPSGPPDRRRFAVYGTGTSIPDDAGDYVGSALLYGGRLVCHVFEVALGDEEL